MPEQAAYNLEEAQEEAKKMQDKIENGEANNYGRAEQIIKSEAARKKIDKQKVIDFLHKGDYVNFGRFINSRVRIIDEISSSPEIQQIAKSEVERLLSIGGYLNKEHAFNLIDIFKLPSEFISSSPRIQEEVKRDLIASLSLGHIERFHETKNKFLLSDEVINLPDIQQAAKKGVGECLSYGKIAEAIRIRDEFSLKSELFQHAVDSAFNLLITNGLINRAFEIRKRFSLSGELVKIGAMAGIRYCLYNRKFDDVFKIKNELSISEDVFQSIIKDKLVELLNGDWYDYAMEIKSKFFVSEETTTSQEVQRAALRAIKNSLIDDSIGRVAEIKANFLVSSDELDFMIEQKLFEYIIGDRLEYATKIKDAFHISEKNIQNNYSSFIKNEKWDLVLKIAQYFPICQQIYKDFLEKQKEIAKNGNLSFSERQKAINALAGLSENGETSISGEFSKIVFERSKQKEAPESKWGLDGAQEAAFYTLMRLVDNPESNGALFNLLLNENVNDTVKYAILKKLSSEGRNFFNEDMRGKLRLWLQNRKSKNNKLDWRELEFIGEIDKISSAETRHISLWCATDMLGSSLTKKEGMYDFWEKHKEIPQNVFLQLLRLNSYSGDSLDEWKLLENFRKTYSDIRKDNTKKENLLYGIVNLQACNWRLVHLLMRGLTKIEFGSRKDADLLSELFRQVSFFGKIENIKNYSQHEDSEDDEGGDEQKTQLKTQELSQEIKDIFSKKAGNLEDLISLLKEAITRKIQEILPDERITGEKIETLEKKWGNLEPIFTYLGRFPQLKEYISEIVANIDTEENWKYWRYDIKNNAVESQVGHLTSEQLEIWKGDYFSELGELMIAESGSEKPKQVQDILQRAIVVHRHIFNPEMRQGKNEFIQELLERVFGEIAQSPDKKSEIVEREIKYINESTNAIDAITNFNNIPRIRQISESILPSGIEIAASAKIKNAVNFLSNYLPKNLSETLSVNYVNAENQGKIMSNILFTAEMRTAIEQKIKEIEQEYQKSLRLDNLKKLGLDPSSVKNLDQFYQKRQELKSAIDLLRLCNLSNKLIATNRIIEKSEKGGGEAITSVVDRLKKYFKGSPLLQDINNIEFALKEKIDFGEKRRLAMVLSDDPQMLWQAGKYPIGNGSCQHYAEGSHANRLMGYVGDANCKVAYLVDLNKLPADIKKELEKKGFEDIKDKIPVQELLNASLARSIVKMTKDNENGPVILLEPTYTVIYKSDDSMDRYFNIFIDVMVAESMNAKVARGGGKESLAKGYSRSPEDQYEDLDLGSVKFVHKLSKSTKEDMKMMEMIRSSR